MSITSTSSKKLAKPTARTHAGKTAVSESRLMRDCALSGSALVAVSATPEPAREFMTRLGVMTRTGKPKKLIRG